MDGRWELMGGPLGRVTVVDGPSSLGIGETVHVVPCDDAAIERGMNALEASDKDYRYVSRADIRIAVEAVLNAAGETP